MPTPDQWTEQDFEGAKALLASGKGSANQRAQLENALNAYWTSKTGAVGMTDLSGEPNAPDTPDRHDPGAFIPKSGHYLPVGDQPSSAMTRPTTERVSRATKSSDPFANYDAETQRMSAGAEGPRPQQGQTPPGKLETFGNSAINAMNLGMGDSLAAAEGINALGGDIGQLEDVKGQIASRRAEGKRANPFSAGAGELAGLAASPAMAAIGPMGGALGAAGLTGRAARIAGGLGSGAAQGAAGGAALAPDGARGEGAMMGGALGGALGAGLAAFSGDAGAIGGKADELTGRAQGATASDLEKMMKAGGPDAVREFGAAVQRTGIDSLEKAHAVLERVGPAIGDLSRSAKAPVDLSDAGIRLAKIAQRLNATQDPALQQTARKLFDHAAPMVQKPLRSYEDAHTLRVGLDKIVYDMTSAVGEKNSAYADNLRQGVGLIREAMDNAAAREGPEFQQAMNSLNDQYSVASKVYDMRVGQRAADMTGDLPITPTDIVSGGLRSGRRRPRILNGAAKGLGATLPELVPLSGGALGRFATPDEEMQ